MAQRGLRHLRLLPGEQLLGAGLGSGELPPLCVHIRPSCPLRPGLLLRVVSLQPDMMVLNEVIRAMDVDALASSHPLSSKEDDVQTPEDIMQLFDTVTYSKVRRRLPSVMEASTSSEASSGL